MAEMGARDEVDSLMRGQAEVWRHMYAFADSMALKCAVELRIADIIHSHDGRAHLTQIASSIGAAAPDLGSAYLSRIMRLLVRNKIFSVEQSSEDSGDPLYGLTDVSRWLVQSESGLNLSPMVLLVNHPCSMAPWHLLSQSVKDGELPFGKAHGCSVWEFASKSSDFNNMFNDAMACFNRLDSRAVVAKYKECFDFNGTLVDVGGGVGAFLAEIVKLHPNIRGINFDLPHVIHSAPSYEGVTHVAGNMFGDIPKADAVVLKAVLHNWGDNDCVKILKNCRKSIDENTGKLIIIDLVIEPQGEDPFESSRMATDLVMLSQCVGGMERTKTQWKKILEEGGFPNYKIIKLPTLPSIIEAYPA